MFKNQLAARQLWNPPAPTSTHSQPHCTPFTLPANGVLSLADKSVVTLTADVIFQPECTGVTNGESFTVNHMRDPFYASTIPMVYVISAATVIAWVLVIMLTITPRSSFLGATAAPAFSNGHGIIGGANGGTFGISGAGSRPWLQKVAALAVAISLTIATADTLEVAERQYGVGYMDAGLLRREVLGSLEIRITRVISDVFLWLAQVQTLIRLFPRHREKVLIKWIGFILILFDSVFSCLNSFLINSAAKGRHFVDAVPALSYLFELALGLLYAAWVIYYSLTKRRYAFYHPKMRNISLIALLSVVSIVTPVVFFITDVSNQDVAGWGDYFRWVGAAAASVVVWEWVERIEALEYDEKKDTILGREIFDGDEMLDLLPEQDTAWTQSRNLRRNFRRQRRDDDPSDGNSSSLVEHGPNRAAHRMRSRHQQSPSHYPLGRAHAGSQQPNSNNQFDHDTSSARRSSQSKQQAAGSLGGLTPPPAVASPVSRADTTSAASTVYVVRYHPMADMPQPIRRRSNTTRGDRNNARPAGGHRRWTSHEPPERDIIESEEEIPSNPQRDHSIWHSVPHPFKRKRHSPPQEVQRAREAAGQRTTTPARNQSLWDMRNRLSFFSGDTGKGNRESESSERREDDLPVTVIPAQPRGSNRTWSPNEQAQGRQSSPHTTYSTTLGGDSQQAILHCPQGMPAASTPSSAGGHSSSTRRSTPHTVSASWNGPPRADDISPVLGCKTGTIVVPAPPRRMTSQQTLPTPRAATATGASRTTETSADGSGRHTPPHPALPPDG